MSEKDDKYYLFQKKETPKPKKGVLALLGVITLVWLAGVVLLFMKQTRAGIICWVASFLTGFVVFLFNRNKDTLDEVREAEMLAATKTEGDAKDEAKQDK